jgi:ferredoxin
MKPYKQTSVPEINHDYCIGCGACQHSCPVEGDRAIVVTPEDIHTIAYTPTGTGQPQVDTSADFPF